MNEIPLVYPNHVHSPRRYVVDFDNKRLLREDGPVATKNLPPMEEALPGAASVSSLKLNGKDVILTTSAKVEDPEVLCIALSWTEDALESPAMMELDVRELGVGQLVSVKAFAHFGEFIRLLLVDYQGTIVTITLTAYLGPADVPIQILKASDYIEEIPLLQEAAGSELQSTMVSFVSSSLLIMALAPFVLTIDLEAKQSAVWSETQCLEDMRSRSSSLVNILSNVGDLILGKIEVGVMDMPPTAALCLTTTANPLLDPTFCVTLHSDASIRKWKIDPEVSLLPLEVTTLDATNLPLPSAWSDSRSSISLCARLYEQTYALAVHVKTDGVYNKDEEQNSSDCHLWVYSGSQQLDPATECVSLNVPNEAMSLVGMEFAPNMQRCTLSVLFEYTAEEDRSASMQLIYPPSMMYMVSPKPEVINHKSLDTIAATERERIRSLLFGPSVLEDSEDATLEEALHRLDSMYLKYLFRPMFPRGTGTVLPPSEACICRALSKMVYGTKREPGMSVELATVRAMYEWRHKENRKLLAMTPVKNAKRRLSGTPESETAIVAVTSPFSVYESFVFEDENEESQTDMILDGEEDDLERLEEERSSEVEAHENRWRRFLLQVWEEEQVLRLPLCISWLDNIPVVVTIRAGITTVSTKSNVQKSFGPWAILDDTATKLLRLIEEDKAKSSRLYSIEHQVANSVAKAELAVSPLTQRHPLLLELTALGRWAWSKEEEDLSGISDAEHEKLEQTISTLSASQLVGWLQETPRDTSGSLLGLGLAGKEESNRTQGRITWSQKQVANCQLRHAACSLSVRCIDAVRRLQLSRCLLLLDLVEGSHAREAALRAYLHSIAVLWTSAQRVPMPSTSLKSQRQIRLGEKSEAPSPPNKRLSLGDDASSILAPHSFTMTTTMDVLVIEISQTIDETSSVISSPIGAALLLGQSFFRLAFASRGNIPIGKPSLLPELGALPCPQDDTIATDYPRLALRLLAPYVACSLPEDPADVVISRKESLAECLLIESHSESSHISLKTQMRQMACELLVPKGVDHDDQIDQQMIKAAFRALESFGSSQGSTTTVSQEMLFKTLQQMIQTGTSIEIRRLCELETVKKLFSPLAAGAGNNMDGATRASIHLVANIMLHLSRVMYRLTILERHLGARRGNEDVDNSDILLGFVSSAINEMGKTFPDEVCQVMPEYGTMWSRLFHRAVVACHWRQAYSACVKHPRSDSRERNFKVLVRAMVDSGALRDLLEMCTELGMRASNASTTMTTEDASECVDLYEIASEILAEAVSGDVYTVRAASPEPESLSDFQGALYALHASQQQWRRAAQSMDLRYLNAKKALYSGAQLNFTFQSTELRDGLIVEDIVLASLGAANAIELVKENAHRFLVSGEFGPYNTITVDGFDESRNSITRTKRVRSDPEGKMDNDGKEGTDRLSNFMTVGKLEGRAIRSIALRTLFLDRSTDHAFTKSSFSRAFETSKLDIEELFRNGYYRCGLLLAKAWSKNREVLTGSSRPGGHDLFYDSLSHLLYAYLIPLSIQPASKSFRPSSNQLHAALDDFGANHGVASYIMTGRNGKIADLLPATVHAAAMELVRNLTLSYSSAETPVALDVATCFLDQQGGCGQMPAWLERVLIGADEGSPSLSGGLFARRSKSGSSVYLGDPSALLTLYTKRGMFVEACNIVTVTLSGLGSQENGSRESRASSRLPEKGDIDFVPYRKIDILWNLIDFALSNHKVDASEGKLITLARDKMEAALEKHFALMKISELGMRSARALQQGSSQ